MENVMNFINKVRNISLLILPFSMAFAVPQASAQSVAATTTLDVCEVGASGLWRYSGVVAVTDTRLGVVTDFRIQNKVIGDFIDIYKVPVLVEGEAALSTGTSYAKVVPYSVDAPPLVLGSIRNAARVTSGAALLAESNYDVVEQVCACPPPPTKCARTQGYWGSKPGVAWPAGYDRNAMFFSSGLTWQQILNTSPQGSGYLVLAHQYIAAVLNVASGTVQPTSIKTTLAQAKAWFASGTTPASCASGACATQKSWAAVLDSYNNGTYPGGPKHCVD
jgi:hypothetical protein